MFCPKKVLFTALSLTILLGGFVPQAVFASRAQYFDFGPYYNSSPVLGFSFSSLEELPAPSVPESLMPPTASGLMPDSPFYPLENFVENVQLTFTFDPVRKEEIRLEFAAERLSEAKTLMEQGKTEAAATALDGYSQAIGEVAQNLTTLTAQGNPDVQALTNKAEEVASAQVVVAQNLTLSSEPAKAEEWARVAKVAQKALDEVAEVNGEAPIPEDLSDGIQKLKEQGLISEEESNKLYGLGSRSEVREELNKLASSGQFPASELSKLDTAVAQNYPEVHEAMTANFQVAELRVYRTLPQPSEKVLEEMQKWQESPGTPPSNDIKPYLWHNRAADLAKEVDLTNFSPDQQAEVARFYPQAIGDNPTYTPLPSPSPNPSLSPSPSPTQTTSETTVTDQNITATPSPTPIESVPTPILPQAEPYLQESTGALPGDQTYFLKEWGENLQFTFTFDPAEKARVKMQQAERRLAEAQVLSDDPKKATYYENAIKNYQMAMNDASSYLKSAKDEERAWEVAEQLESQAARHEVVLEKGLLPAPKDIKLLSEAIKATEDALDRSADVQGRPALPPALSDRLGDLKAQGLILPEEAENLVSSNSREEVREKIRKLVELGSFPPADSKKLDEAQVLSSPSDYNQLVEVRKVEELQKLRSVQSEFAQTPTLRTNATSLSQREVALFRSIDPSLIKPEDLGGREDLVEIYNKLASSPRPINSGQFGAEATPGAQLTTTPPSRQDAVLSTCPEGAVFKQLEGCVWADSGKKINDYDQYKCDGPRQYYSFAARKCVAYEPGTGFKDDSQPICPVGYNWAWQAQSCQAFTGGGTIPLPTPRPEPTPKDEKEIEERSKTCPEGSSYKVPDGCVWDKNDKPIYDSSKYRCGRGQYYSFEELKCVAAPKEGETYPKDSVPICKEAGSFWSWSDGKCIYPVFPLDNQGSPDASKITIGEIKPSFATPNSPFYPLKQWGESIRLATAFTPEAKQEVRISQARERLAEGYAALEKGEEETFAKSLSAYTAKMQEMYNDLTKSSLSDSAKKAIGDRLTKEAVEQNLILQQIEVVAKSDAASVLSAASSTVILGVDKAADLLGEPAVPDEVKAKVEALPEQMISKEDKKKLLEATSRVEARLAVGTVVAKGGLTSDDAGFLNEDFEAVDQNTQWKIEELKRLEEIATVTGQKKEIEEKIEKNDDIVKKLDEFQKTFEVGKEVPVEIRPYVRLTRIEEVAQTVRPDIVKLEEFSNRKDVILAVATLQEEFRPTKEAIQKVEDFRRKNPNTFLPPELARIEALSFSLGVRTQAGPCFLPTPPFSANTPCPPPGAAIPVASYINSGPGYAGSTQPATTTTYSWQTSVDKDGKSLVYGQGPTATSTGICPDGYHWMYDSGGWCMSNSGNYNSSSNTSYTPSGTGPGYTPYSPYYSAPGAPSAGFGYGEGGGYYSPPSYYGPAPTNYTTYPPSGTVPGSGPKPTAPGQCPDGFHWMSDSGGWCMANSNTYVPPGTPDYSAGTATTETGSYNCGSQPYDPVTKKCKDGACPGGFNWDGSKCVAGNYLPGAPGTSSGSPYYSPNLTQSSCGPGYYWDGRGCIPNYSGSGTSYSSSGSCPSGYWWNGYSCQPSSGTGSTCTYPSGGCPGTGSYFDYSTCSCKTSVSYTSPSSYQYGCTPGYYWDGSRCKAGSNEGSGWSDSAARSQTWCQPPSGGCGSNSYWDYGSCYCRSSSTYSGGGGSSSSNQCQGLSCGGGAWLDYSTCSCRYSGGSGTSSTGSTITCYPPSQGCPGGWYDYGSCSCKSSSYSSGTTSSGGTSTGTSGSTSTSTTTSSGGGGGGSSSGSCPSGYHWMSDNGGWCMSDAARDGGSTSSGGSTTSTTPSTTTSTPTSSEPTPAPSASTTESSSPPPSEPAPSTQTTTSTTESSPPPSTSTESTPPPSP